MIAKIRQEKSKILALTDQMMVSGTNFSIGILITRFLGVENYGRFALYWMVFLFLQGLCTAYIGLPAQVLSNQSNDKAAYLEENNRLGKLVLLSSLLLLYPAFLIYNNITNASFGYGYWLFPLVIVLFLKQEMNRKYFYAQLATHKVVIIDFFAYFLQTPALVLLIIFNEFNLNSLLLTLACTGLISQVVFIFIKTPTRTSFQLKNLPITANWIYAKHLILTTVLQWFSGNFILISAGGIIGLAAVGIIRVLQNIMGVLHVLFLTLENVVPVKASILLNNHSKKHMLTYFKKVALVTGIVYGLLLLLLKLFGTQLLELLYGAEYAQHTNLLDLFIGLYILIFLGTLAQLMLKTLKLNYSIFIAYLLTVLFAFLFATPLLETFAIKGVIIGFAILQLITLSVYFFTLKRALL